MTGWSARTIGVLVACAIAAPGASAEPMSARKRRRLDQADQFMIRHNLYPACHKLGRGLANALGGWLEIPLNMQRYYVPNDTGAGMFTGAAVGVVKGALRPTVGAYETATFLLPYPRGFRPILPPIDYFKLQGPIFGTAVTDDPAVKY